MSGKDFSEELKHKDLPSVLKAGHHVKLTLKLSDDLLLDVAKVEIEKGDNNERYPDGLVA